jgi:hypothetical protein
MVGTYHAIARTGRFDPATREAVIALQATFDATSRGFVIGRQYHAEFLLASSQHEEGLGYVAQAVRGGLADLAWMDHCPLLDTVRGSAQWPALRDIVAARARGIVDSVA